MHLLGFLRCPFLSYLHTNKFSLIISGVAMVFTTKRILLYGLLTLEEDMEIHRWFFLLFIVFTLIKMEHSVDINQKQQRRLKY